MNTLNNILAREAGIVLLPENETLIEARLERMLADMDIPNMSKLLQLLPLPASHDLRQSVINALLVHETSFFRDSHPFTMLREEILPALMEKRRQSRTIRIWSAACSTGQEPYSLAMLIHDRFPELLSWKLEIVATDLSGPVLKAAESGTYHQVAVNRGLPASYLIRYFQRDGLYWNLTPEIRQMVRFEPINLAKPWPFLGRFDIILLRNVLIYFNDETRRSVFRQTHSVLADDGYLILGATESTLNIDRGFKLKRTGRTVYYQKH